MTTMISELYEALINAGATEAKAREAAEALSAENLNSKDNVAELDQRLSGEIAETRKDIYKLQLDVAVLKWMVSATLAGIAAILASVILILVKLFFTA